MDPEKVSFLIDEPSRYDHALVLSTRRAWLFHMIFPRSKILSLFEQTRPSSQFNSAHWTTNAGAPVYNNNSSLTGTVYPFSDLIR